MRSILLVFCFLLTLDRSIGQCRLSLGYSGQPNYRIDTSLSIIPGSAYRFDFSTLSVPDWLILYSDTDTVTFYVGGANNKIAHPVYFGYSEVTVRGGIVTLDTAGATQPPGNFNYGPYSHVRGMLRVNYFSGEFQCGVGITLIGNHDLSTVYNLCVKEISSGTIRTRDTVLVPSCNTNIGLPYFRYESCYRTWCIPVDSSIRTTPLVINPTCENSLNGSIRFPGFSEFDLDSVGIGIYEILVHNSACANLFVVELTTDMLCEYYIPNVFSPNDDGYNDRFCLFTSVPLKYRLQIYDRWGALIDDTEYISNSTGWDGRYRNGRAVPESVYIWVISIRNSIVLSGDVTVYR